MFWVFKKDRGGAPAVEAGPDIKSKTDRFVPPAVYKSSAGRLVIPLPDHGRSKRSTSCLLSTDRRDGRSIKALQESHRRPFGQSYRCHHLQYRAYPRYHAMITSGPASRATSAQHRGHSLQEKARRAGSKLDLNYIFGRFSPSAGLVS